MTFSGGRTQTDFSLEERPMKQEIIRKLSAAVAMSLVVGVSLAACGGGSRLPGRPAGAAAPPPPLV